MLKPACLTAAIDQVIVMDVSESIHFFTICLIRAIVRNEA